MRNRFLTYLVSFDFILSVAITAASFLLPAYLSNSLVKDFSGIAISTLSIIFSVYFAALAIIISSSDDDFIRFLSMKGRYNQIVNSFKYSLAVLFFALLYSVFLYANAAILIEKGFSSQSKYLFCCFVFIFFYGLFVAAASTLDSIQYVLMRVKFINKKDELKAKRKLEEDEANVKRSSKQDQ
jgi:hypothetical protein